MSYIHARFGCLPWRHGQRRHAQVRLRARGDLRRPAAPGCAGVGGGARLRASGAAPDIPCRGRRLPHEGTLGGGREEPPAHETAPRRHDVARAAPARRDRRYACRLDRGSGVPIHGQLGHGAAHARVLPHGAREPCGAPAGQGAAGATAAGGVQRQRALDGAGRGPRPVGVVGGGPADACAGAALGLCFDVLGAAAGDGRRWSGPPADGEPSGGDAAAAGGADASGVAGAAARGVGALSRRRRTERRGTCCTLGRVRCWSEWARIWRCRA